MTVSAHSVGAWVGDVKLDVTDATVTMDEAWSPYIQASITVPITDPAIFDIIDPRNNVHVHLVLEQTFGASEKVSKLTTLYTGGTLAALTTAYTTKYLFQLSVLWFTPWNSFGVRGATRKDFQLGLRSRSINHEGGTIELTLASDEALMQDYALTGGIDYAPGYLSVRSAISEALGRIGLYLQAGSADATITADAATWTPGQSMYDYISPLVQAGGLRFYADEKGAFWLRNDTYIAPGSANLTYTGTIKAADDEITRDGDDWCDAVVIKYTWVDSAGATQVRYDSATQPTFSKVKSLEYDRVYPGAGAAARVLTRALSKGRQQTATAVSDYSIVPSQPLSMVLPNTLTQTGYVAAVTWSLPADDMQVTSRGLVETPVTSWDYQAVGLKWNDIAVGRTWNTY